MLRIPLLLFAVIAFLWAGAGSCSPDVTLTPAAVDTLIYVMAGQSNMAGRGEIDANDTAALEHLLELDKDGHLILKREPNTVYQGWLAGLDCGRSFGISLLQHLPPHKYIMLIQCSVSSTFIREWLGDSIRAGLRLYSNMLDRARTGMKHGLLKGVLWMQGESEADSATGPEYYAQNLSAFVRNFRRDIGLSQLPFFIATLPAWCSKPYKEGVNTAIHAASVDLPAIRLIPTDDLGAKSDSVHLNGAGQRALGLRMADAAWNAY